MKKVNLFTKLLTALLVLCCMFGAVSCASSDKSENPSQGNDESGTGSEAQTKAPSWEKDPVASAFVSEIGGCSETYKGSVSEKKYDKAEDAVADYVAAEIVAADSDCTVTESKLEKKLSQEEIAALGISDSALEGAEKVEMYNVSYESTAKDASGAAKADTGLMMLSSESGSNDSATGKTTGKVVVYVITYKDFFKYFAPVVEDGNTLTKSYYDSIFNAEKYKNCTFEQNIEIAISGSDGERTETMKVTMTSLVKFDNGKIYVESKTDSEMNYMPSSEAKYCFADDGNGNIQSYVWQNGEWVRGGVVGVSSVEDLTPFKNQYLDHSYFSKTDFGCELGKKNFSKYMDTALAAFDVADFGKNMNIDGFVNYYVSGGVLSGLRSEVTMSMQESGVSMKGSIVSTAKCTDYGTTVVEIPNVDAN